MPVFAATDLHADLVAAATDFSDACNGILHYQSFHIAGKQDVTAAAEDKHRSGAGSKYFPQRLHRMHFGKPGGAGGEAKGVVGQQRNVGGNRHGRLKVGQVSGGGGNLAATKRPNFRRKK